MTTIHESTPGSKNLEKLAGIVERITYHNEQNGWSVIKVSSFKNPSELTTVVVHQAKIFAGATMEFWGVWTQHPVHGEQFKAQQAIEKKPATTAALEKYLGSGLIKGVGPAMARRIVSHFKENTLEIFETKIENLEEVPGIAKKKLEQIKSSWEEHRSIRDVMLFLQNYGISTLFATRIFKEYRNQSIQIVQQNPYRLAHDIYGIGFFSADKIALSMGFDPQGIPRLEAGIKHVLSASRDEGHCFLFKSQIEAEISLLLQEEIPDKKILEVLTLLLMNDEIKTRNIKSPSSEALEPVYYSKSLYFDELRVAEKINLLINYPRTSDTERINRWIERYCQKNSIQLSEEQKEAIEKIPGFTFSILTGGPGVGKTTCTKVLAQLLLAMKKKLILAAPTGRAAQRMSDVIGIEAKTIHRLLEWTPQNNGFARSETFPLEMDFIIIDETSMLDISLANHLLKAIPKNAQVLFIGDPDQLPAVGAGNVLSDLLNSPRVKRFQLSQVFRQAQSSAIIRFAHEINHGKMPLIESPIKNKNAFKEKHDCLFVDADEATQDQLQFIRKIKTLPKSIQPVIFSNTIEDEESQLFSEEDLSEKKLKEPVVVIPPKYKHVDIEELLKSDTSATELKAVLKKIHPLSTVHFGVTAVETLLRIYMKSIFEWTGGPAEIQILCPQVRGTLGTLNLNSLIQREFNPESSTKKQIQIGEKIYRVGDRVIQTRNNYDLGVYNGDIGEIKDIDFTQFKVQILFQGGENKSIVYTREDLSEVQLAYAITVHKSQGSEFPIVIIPIVGQHYNMLFRNLVYTGLTRAKKLCVFVGSRKALAKAIQQVDNRNRQTHLTYLINSL